MEDTPIAKGKGSLRKIKVQNIKKELDLNSLSLDMIFNKTLLCCLIHVTDLI